MNKKYIPYIIIAVLFVALMFTMQKCSSANARAIAGAVAAKTANSLAASKQALIDKYAKLNADKDIEIKRHKQTIIDLGGDVTEWHGKSEAAQREINRLKTCPEKLQATNVELDLCQNYVLSLRKNYTDEIGKLTLSYEDKIALKDKEIEEWIKRDGILSKKVVQMTEEIVYLKLKGKRMWSVGPSAGMGINGQPYIGVGIQLSIWRF